MRYVAANKHSPQNCLGKEAWKVMTLTLSRRCLCFLSTRPFCWGLPGRLLWWSMPLRANNVVQTTWNISVPLSLLIILIEVLKWFST